MIAALTTGQIFGLSLGIAGLTTAQIPQLSSQGLLALSVNQISFLTSRNDR